MSQPIKLRQPAVPKRVSENDNGGNINSDKNPLNPPYQGENVPIDSYDKGSERGFGTLSRVKPAKKTRAEALELLVEWTKNKNLLKHSLAVEAAMVHLAKIFKGDEAEWGLVGLLHDFDYEKYPSLADHPYKGQEILKQLGYPKSVRRGIMAHAPHTGTSRETMMEKAIFAVDELTGFIVAVTLVKPNKKLAAVDVASVRKKMKQRAFAAAVKREEIELGATELGLSLDEHIAHVLKAMQSIADQLGL